MKASRYLSILTCGLALGAMNPGMAQPSVTRNLHLESGRLSDVLRHFADQMNLQVVFYVEDTREIRVGGLEGNYTPERALDVLLQGSGLEYEFVDGQTVSVKRKEAKTAGGRVAGGEIRVARAPEAAPTENAVEGQDEKLDEIVVTAQKRQQQKKGSSPVLSADLVTARLLGCWPSGCGRCFTLALHFRARQTFS